MLVYKNSQPLISIHLPKCGGSSLKYALDKWFTKDLYFHYFDEENNKLPERIKQYNTGFFGMLGRGVCIHGHFNKDRGFSVKDYYPDAKQFITFLRDPLEIYISNYFFVNQKELYRDGERYHIKKNLNEYIKNVTQEGVSWYMRHLPGDVKEDNVSEYLSSKFVFVGVMEQYQKSLDILADELGKQRIKIPKYNETERENYEIDEDTVEEFRRVFSLDYNIYKSATRYINSKKTD